MLLMERIPDQIGYLVLTEDGAVLASGGELENNERIANIITGLITLTDKIDPETTTGAAAAINNDAYNKIAIIYTTHCYVICLSNKKIYVVKKKLRATLNQEMSINENLVDL